MAERSRCSRAKVGAVIVSKENRVAATGYNGPPADWTRNIAMLGRLQADDCRNWCPRANTSDRSLDYSDCPSNHAEINALMHSSREDREGGVIYVTGSVCMACAKAIANSGIRYVHLVNVNPEEERHRNPEAVNSFMRACELQVTYVDVGV